MTARRPAPLPLADVPMALECERAVLGGCLLEGTEGVRRVAAINQPSDFWPEANRIIYGTMLALADAGRPVDLLTLADELRGQEQLDVVGGPAYLALLEVEACIAAQLLDYAARVREAGLKRDVMALASRLSEHARNGAPAATLLLDLSTAHAELSTRRGLGGLEAPDLTSEGDDVLVTWPERGVALALRNPRETSDGLSVEADVLVNGRGVHLARLSLLSTPARETLAKRLDHAAPGRPWRELIDAACRAAIERLRAGAPVETLVPRRRTGPASLVDPLLPLLETTVIYADGGSGKSYLGLTLAVAVVTGRPIAGLVPRLTGPTLLLDYESGPEEHEDRLARLVAGHNLDPAALAGLHRREMTRPLSEDAARLRVEIARLGPALVIVDSAAPAAGQEPEGADAATRTLTALRSFGPTTRLVLAHVPSGDVDKVFGSVFWRNLPRNVWRLRRSDDGSDEHTLAVSLTNTKNNLGPLAPPMALRLDFLDGAATWHGADLAATPDLLDKAPLPQRILTVLRAGALPIAELAERLAAKPDTVSRALRRLRPRVAPLPETTPPRWGLATR